MHKQTHRCLHNSLHERYTQQISQTACTVACTNGMHRRRNQQWSINSFVHKRTKFNRRNVINATMMLYVKMKISQCCIDLLLWVRLVFCCRTVGNALCWQTYRSRVRHRPLLVPAKFFFIASFHISFVGRCSSAVGSRVRPSRGENNQIQLTQKAVTFCRLMNWSVWQHDEKEHCKGLLSCHRAKISGDNGAWLSAKEVSYYLQVAVVRYPGRGQPVLRAFVCFMDRESRRMERIR